MHLGHKTVRLAYIESLRILGCLIPEQMGGVMSNDELIFKVGTPEKSSGERVENSPEHEIAHTTNL